jgi:hypothetical protein
MSKYGVELTKILEPDLSPQSLNDELAVVGHKDGSVGNLIVKLIERIYDMTYKLNALGYPVNDELKEYVKAKYEEKAPTGDSIKDLISRADDVFDTNELKIEYQSCYRVKVSTSRGVLLFEGYIANTYGLPAEKCVEFYEPRCGLGSLYTYHSTHPNILKVYKIEEFSRHACKVPSTDPFGGGWADIYRFEGKIAYERFLEVFSPLLFLGIAWIDNGALHVLH